MKFKREVNSILLMKYITIPISIINLFLYSSLLFVFGTYKIISGIFIILAIISIFESISTIIRLRKIKGIKTNYVNNINLKIYNKYNKVRSV